MEAYTDLNGKVTHFVIGVESKVNYSVVVEIKTGIVKFVDDEKGKMRKIAPSLEEFIKDGNRGFKQVEKDDGYKPLSSGKMEK